MVALSFFLRVLVPFDIHIGWWTLEDYLSPPTSCARAVIPQSVPKPVHKEYRAPHVKFADDVDTKSSSAPVPDVKPSQASECHSEDRLRRPDSPSSASIVQFPGREHRLRRSRSLLARQEAKDYPAKGRPDTLFRDTASAIEEASHPDHLAVQALKAELYDKEVPALRQQVDELSEQLTDAREVLTATEMHVEEVLAKNIKLEKKTRSLISDNTQLSTLVEQHHDDVVTLLEWIYSVQGPLIQLGLYPTSLNEKLNNKMKVPRAYPTLAPRISSRLASEDYSTPPSTPPLKPLSLKIDKGSFKPQSRSEPEWDDDSMRPFYFSSPVACSSPRSSRSSSPLPLTSSGPASRSNSPSRLAS